MLCVSLAQQRWACFLCNYVQNKKHSTSRWRKFATIVAFNTLSIYCYCRLLLNISLWWWLCLYPWHFLNNTDVLPSWVFISDVVNVTRVFYLLLLFVFQRKALLILRENIIKDIWFVYICPCLQTDLKLCLSVTADWKHNFHFSV